VVDERVETLIKLLAPLAAARQYRQRRIFVAE
jgi:hypothetical protein